MEEGKSEIVYLCKKFAELWITLKGERIGYDEGTRSWRLVEPAVILKFEGGIFKTSNLEYIKHIESTKEYENGIIIREETLQKARAKAEKITKLTKELEGKGEKEIDKILNGEKKE